ncbi:hypothetical protein IMAU30132_00083 [Lactobacillus helveticus]|uniref:hypothetical protein n=1 Tax=Lactobacillus helveticus TaxID=1587 RepID=UPI0015621092|nr:hypothetical protein [Lactobacillus helveticus]NRO47733.1 hypothetical protein [Lactobacillus helveticus]
MTEQEFDQKFEETLKKVSDQTTEDLDKEREDFIRDFDNAKDLNEKIAFLIAYTRTSSIRYSTRLTYEMLKEFLVNEK